MSRILFLSVIIASLSSVVGCGASARGTHSSVSPASVNVAAARDESCWSPPDAYTLSVSDSAEAPTVVRTTEKASYRPNRQERPTSGAVHAATY